MEQHLKHMASCLCDISYDLIKKENPLSIEDKVCLINYAAGILMGASGLMGDLYLFKSQDLKRGG